MPFDRQTQQALFRTFFLLCALAMVLWLGRHCGPAAEQLLRTLEQQPTDGGVRTVDAAAMGVDAGGRDASRDGFTRN